MAGTEALGLPDCVRPVSYTHLYRSANATEEDKKYISEVVVDRVANLKLEVATLREQLAEEDYKLLPLSYIAQKYFGKSAA